MRAFRAHSPPLRERLTAEPRSLKLEAEIGEGPSIYHDNSLVSRRPHEYRPARDRHDFLARDADIGLAMPRPGNREQFALQIENSTIMISEDTSICLGAGCSVSWENKGRRAHVAGEVTRKRRSSVTAMDPPVYHPPRGHPSAVVSAASQRSRRNSCGYAASVKFWCSE
jgi:hypothetical protein